jgi:uncharacterized membrane protein
MTSHSDVPAFEARLDFVHARLLELHARVASLEAQLHGRAPLLPSPPTPAPTPAPSLLAPVPAPDLQHADASERGPVRVLAVAGGGALLLGLACFVGYAIEQDWLAPSVRFVLAAIASALLTLAAWPIARRNYHAVAGAIGGAGLGGWFAAFLVARHAHALVSVPQAFVALAAGAAACLLIADRLHLRLMAGLATVAACATPVLVASDGRLHELMIYQLIVVIGLMLLDARRRWPELPTMGLLASWLLAARWAAQNGASGALVAWSTLLLIVSAGSAWRLLGDLSERSEQAHTVLRLLLASLATWAAAAAAFDVDSLPFALATALLSAWQLGLAVFLHRREHDANALCLALGWLQALALGPALFEQAMLAWWWIGMSVTAMVVPWIGLQRQRGAMTLVPALAAIGYCVAVDQPWSLMLGLLAAAVVLAASMWPRPETTHERPIPWLAIVGTLAWATVVLALGPASIVAQLGLALLPIAAVLGFCCARPSAHALLLATALLGLGLFGVIAAIIDTEALLLRGSGDAGERFGMAALLLLLAGFSVATIARTRLASRLAEQARERSSAIGLLTAAAVGLALLLGVALLTDGSIALGQVGYSLSVAAVGLGLIVAGLRLDDELWRQVGLAAIAAAAGKIVLFDLAAAAVGWRALSFVGLGAILIGGSFAYSRAARRAYQSP